MSEPKSSPLHADLTPRLCGIWREVLKVDHIGVDDNFFDAGGYSLLFVDLSRLIAERLDEQMSIVDLLRCPTVRAQVELMQRRRSGDRASEQERNVTGAGVGRSRLLQQRVLREDPGHE
jgi:phosphopantetheine binding protein